MAKNEKTSPQVATLASKILSGEIKRPTEAQIKTLAASVLTQSPDRPAQRPMTFEEALRRQLGR